MNKGTEWENYNDVEPQEGQKVIVWVSDMDTFYKAVYLHQTFWDGEGDKIKGVTHFFVPSKPQNG
jgi:hypothetical protein